MAVVNIITPQSTIISIGKQSIPVRWSGQYDDYQTHYEIQYRLKSVSAWSTLGKVSSTAKEANLQEIANRLESPFLEVCYRIVVYYDKNMTGERQVGYEYSNVYMIVYIPEYRSKLQEFDGNKIHTYPLYDDIEDETIPFSMVQISETKTKKLPFLEANHALASKNTVNLATDTKKFASNELNSYSPIANGEGYQERIVSYTQYGVANDTFYGYYRPMITHSNIEQSVPAGYGYKYNTKPVYSYGYYRQYVSPTYYYWYTGYYKQVQMGYVFGYIYNGSSYSNWYYVNDYYYYYGSYTGRGNNGYYRYQSYYYLSRYTYYRYSYINAYNKYYYSYSVPAYYYASYVRYYQYRNYISGQANYYQQYTYR